MTTFRQLYQQRGKNLYDADGNATIDTPEAVDCCSSSSMG